jgi:hypothetical protein
VYFIFFIFNWATYFLVLHGVANLATGLPTLDVGMCNFSPLLTYIANIDILPSSKTFGKRIAYFPHIFKLNYQLHCKLWKFSIHFRSFNIRHFRTVDAMKLKIWRRVHLPPSWISRTSKNPFTSSWVGNTYEHTHPPTQKASPTPPMALTVSM